MNKVLQSEKSGISTRQVNYFYSIVRSALLGWAAICLPIQVFSQTGAIDSLETALTKAGHDTIAISIMKDLAEHYYYVDAEKSRIYGERVIALSEKTGYTRGKWDGLNIQGYLHYRNGAYDSAILYFRQGFDLSGDPRYDPQRVFANYWSASSYMGQAKYKEAENFMKKSLELAQQRNLSNDIANGFKGLGMIYYSQGEYRAALAHYLKADSLMRDEISINHGDLLQNIGLIYHVLKNAKPEKEYYLRAREVYRQLGDLYGLSTIELRLGNYEKEYENYKKAETHLLKARDFFEGMNDRQKVGEVINYLGRLYLLTEEYEKAVTYFHEAILILEETSFMVPLCVAYLGLGEAYIETGHPDKAAEALNESRRLSGISHTLPNLAEVLKSLARLYAANGDFKIAYETQLEYQQAADSLAGMRNSEVIHEMEAKYQNERKQREIEKLATASLLKEQKAKTQRNFFFLIIGAVAAAAGALYFMYRIKQKANARLTALDELKSRFFTNISHEFRTPLTLISGPVEERLKNGHLHPGDRIEFEMIKRNSDLLVSLVDQLLDLSKIESGSMQLQAAPGDITNLLRVIASSFGYQAEKKQIAYHVEIPDAQEEAWFDVDAVQKIISNLLSNALKYTPENGVVTFRAALVYGRLEMIFENSGAGIPARELGKVFDRFYQLDGTQYGSGIGLALVKELTELLHGRVRVESAAGKTTFTVVLPLRKEAYAKDELAPAAKEAVAVKEELSPTTPPTEAIEEVMGDEKPLILIIDDNEDVRKFVRSVLEQNYSLIEAAEGASGIALATAQIPDFIISDVMMPGIDGMEVCRRLKTNERTSHIPVILLTAKAGDEHALAGLETGADDYMTKPFNSDMLKVRIRKLIDLRKKLHTRYSQEVVLKPKEISLTPTDVKFLEKVQQVIDLKLPDSAFTAEVFSREMGMSRMHLHRKLKGLTGLSANAFIRAERLKLAANMLRTSGVNVSEIGYAVGFSDPSYFAKCFKEFHQCTPTEFADRREYT